MLTQIRPSLYFLLISINLLHNVASTDRNLRQLSRKDNSKGFEWCLIQRKTVLYSSSCFTSVLDVGKVSHQDALDACGPDGQLAILPSRNIQHDVANGLLDESDAMKGWIGLYQEKNAARVDTGWYWLDHGKEKIPVDWNAGANSFWKPNDGDFDHPTNQIQESGRRNWGVLDVYDFIVDGGEETMAVPICEFYGVLPAEYREQSMRLGGQDWTYPAHTVLSTNPHLPGKLHTQEAVQQIDNSYQISRMEDGTPIKLPSGFRITKKPATDSFIISNDIKAILPADDEKELSQTLDLRKGGIVILAIPPMNPGSDFVIGRGEVHLDNNFKPVTAPKKSKNKDVVSPPAKVAAESPKVEQKPEVNPPEETKKPDPPETKAEAKEPEVNKNVIEDPLAKVLNFKYNPHYLPNQFKLEDSGDFLGYHPAAFLNSPVHYRTSPRFFHAPLNHDGLFLSDYIHPIYRYKDGIPVRTWNRSVGGKFKSEPVKKSKTKRTATELPGMGTTWLSSPVKRNKEITMKIGRNPGDMKMRRSIPLKKIRTDKPKQE